MISAEKVKALQEASGTPKHRELLAALTDDELHGYVNAVHGNQPTHIKAAAYQGYKKRIENAR